MGIKIVDIRKNLPKHPTRKWKKRKNVTHIVIHTTGSSSQDPYKTARYHISPGPQNHISKKGCPGICYSDYIDQKGIIYHCNNYDDITWHAGFYNGRSVGVVMAFRGQDSSPSSIQLDSLIKHITKLCLYLKVFPSNIIGHREVPGMWQLLGNGSKKFKKVCPGLKVDLERIRYEITGRLQRRLISEELYNGPVDYNFGPRSKAALKAFNPLKYLTFSKK